MAERKVNRLTTRQCDAFKDPGLYADGGGLWLQLKKGGGKSWILRFKMGGKVREMGLGSYADVTVKEARAAADEARGLIKDGKNPIVERQIAEAAVLAPAGAAIPLFGAFAQGLVDTWLEEFKSKPHRRAWIKTFGDAEGKVKDPYAALILDKPIADVDTAAVLAVLQPLWKLATTASRVRGRIERVLDAAKVLGYRSGENPARWGGHLEIILKRPKKLTRGHHKAMPYAEVPGFVRELRAVAWTKMKGGVGRQVRHSESVTESMSVLALQFTILTVSRTSEVILARRPEVDFERRVWTVPPARMKEGREHRVPLPDRAIEILRKVWPFSNDPSGYIFRGNSGDGHLSNMAMAMCLRGVDSTGCTVHGFRSSFSDWRGEETDFPREVAEAALAHLIGDEAERAYRRGDALERRRKLMDAWAAYVGG